VINGGKGVWGEVAMAAHPSLSQEDAQKITTWIMSLGNEATAQKTLPPTGSYTPKGDQKPGNVLVLSASYTDKGTNNGKVLTGNNSLVLSSNYRQFNGREEVEGFTKGTQSGAAILILPNSSGWFALDSIDMTGVRSAKLIIGWRNPPEAGFGFEVRLDELNGKLLGSGRMPAPKKDQRLGEVPISVQAIQDNKLHKLYFIYKPGNQKKPIEAGIARIQFN
jgi:hypothetical protein